MVQLFLDLLELKLKLHPSPATLDVLPLTDTSLDLWGKTCTDLQSNASVANNTMTANLKYIEDYTSGGFDMSLGHHFAAISVSPSAIGSTISFTFNGTTKDLDEDLAIVLQMTEEKKALDVVFEEKVDNTTVATYTLHLSGLTLDAQ